MALQKKIMEQMKVAMKNKDNIALESLRAIKSALLLAKTGKGIEKELSENQEVKLLQKLVKQRRDSATLYSEQGREDLAITELAQRDVIAQFLPKPLDEAEITEIVKKIISTPLIKGMKDMGKVMKIATEQLAGKADGKVIARIVKQQLQ